MSDDNKNLSDDLNDMIGDAKENTKKAADKISQKASEMADDAKEFAGEAKEKASEFADEAKEAANEFANEAKEFYNEATGENKKIIAGVLGILFGYLGIHKFILGYTKEGIIQIIITIVTCSVGGIVGFIEGIIYLTKSDEEFYNTYQVGKKPWF